MQTDGRPGGASALTLVFFDSKGAFLEGHFFSQL